jgi:hypothetical protein
MPPWLGLVVISVMCSLRPFHAVPRSGACVIPGHPLREPARVRSEAVNDEVEEPP